MYVCGTALHVHVCCCWYTCCNMYMYMLCTFCLRVHAHTYMYNLCCCYLHVCTCMYMYTPASSHSCAGPTGKLPPPKLVVNSRTRTESVASAEPSSSKKGGAKGAADKESQLLRSTSEENVVSAGNSKVKGQSKGGIFSRSGTRKDSGPPKKPSRPWLRGKEKGSPQNARPQSALITNNVSEVGIPLDKHDILVKVVTSTRLIHVHVHHTRYCKQ